MACLALIACGLSQEGMQAQVGPPGRMPTPQFEDLVTGLSLAQALALAIEREPSLRAARAEVGVAEGERLQASLRPNPSASFMYQAEPGGTDRQASAQVDWPMDLFRKSGRVAVADRHVEAAGHRVGDRVRTLSAEVRRTYGEVLAGIRELRLTDELVSAAERQLDLVRARVEQGAAPPLERDVLAVELQRLTAERFPQMGHIEHAMIELKRLIGAPAEAPLLVSDTLEGVVEREARVAAPSDAAAVTRIRPDVLEAESNVAAAEASIARARADGRLDLNLFARYMRMDAGFPQLGTSPGGGLERVRGRFNYLAAGATLMLPWRNANQGAVAVAQAEREAAAWRRDAALASAAAEIAAARTRDAHAQHAVAAYNNSLIALARQNLGVVEETYALGRATVLDVLAERRRYLELQQAFTAALREAFDARTALRRATGEGS